MNREIKFRGKCAASSRYAGEWVEGGLIVPQVIKDNEVLIVSAYSDDCISTYHVDADTVCQFTGLSDKNGKEVYEGDILRVYDGQEHFNIIVKWNKEAMAFMACYCDGIQSPLSWFSNLLSGINKIELLGNIYDNKELLEE